MKGSCILIPEINGESSILYKEIEKKHKERPIVNLIYTLYLQPGVQREMDNSGYKRNKQGQHAYKDIYKFLDIKNFLSQQEVSIQSEAISLGIMNGDLSYVNFTNVEEAYDIAKQYNNTHSGRLAYVVQHGNDYNVILINKDARTIKHLYDFNRQSVIWDFFKSEVRKANINVENLIQSTEGTLNPSNVESFLNTLKILKASSNDLLSLKDIKVFLTLGENLSKTQVLLNRGWGDLNETAEKCYNALQNPTTVASSVIALINNVINECKLKSSFDPNKVLQHISDTIAPEFDKESKERNIQDVLTNLEKEHQINSNAISKKINSINSLEDIALEAINVLTKEIRRIEADKGVTKTVLELEETKKLIGEELASKRTYYGITSFLKQALGYATKVHELIMNVPVGGTNAEYIRNCASALTKARNLKGAYYDILNALCNMDVFIINENLKNEDKKELQNKAKEVKEILDKIENKIVGHLREDLVVRNLQEELGDSSKFGKSYVDIVKMMEYDTSIVDYVGQLAKSSDPILAASGSIIRNAQHARDKKLDDLSTRIGRITKKLYDAGYNTEFMYDENGMLITEEGVDWEKYKKERNKAIFKFKKEFGYRGFVLKQAIEQWEIQNTENKVVDSSNGRTERIPNIEYRLKNNPFTSLSNEQKEYYREAMSIKGELGSLLPKYAQQHFLPPQLRASWVDIIKRGIDKELSAKEVAKSLLDRIKPFKIREDDTEFITNTQYGDYDGTPLRDIPVFYCTPLSNKDELLKDFSSALQSFASTAYNYEAMAGIRDNILAIQDLVNGLDVEADSTDIVSFWDNTTKKVTYIFNTLKQKSKQNRTSAILDAWIERELYNINYKGNKKINKIVNGLIKYNSIVRLSANVLGATANITAGILQTVIEAGGRKYYNVGDLMWAQGQMLSPGKHAGAAWDILTGDKQNKFTLIHEFFDMSQDNYSEKARQRYHKNAFRRLFGKFNIMGMYSGGEFLIRSMNGMAVLNHEKVLLNGKKTSLSQVFEKTINLEGYPELKIKDGVTTLDGKTLTIDSPYLQEVKTKIKSCSDECFGAFSDEDKGVLNQYWLGRLAMNFRQWMVEHYSRRYRLKHWDYTKKDWVEGYYITPFRLLKDLIKGIKDQSTTFEVFKNELSESDKANCRKALSEVLLFAVLCGLSFGIGDVDDNEDYLLRFWLYNIKRMQSETEAAMPWGIITESKKLIKSPIPAITTISGLMYPITGLSDINDTIERGRYAGWNKYVRNILWYSVPFYKQIDQLYHMDEEDALFTIFTDKGLQ